ncbi:MAG: glycosyltransferase [Planctomycetaceae bacterium]|nr:glycosyltransferase [Planctomycetaceae bacterium]
MVSHLVIPCYNEAERLPSDRILEFLRDNPHWTLVFVDDGSRDTTLDLLNEIHQQEPLQTAILSLKQNSGKAEAVRTGMFCAITQFAAERVGFADADLATPLEEVMLLDEVLDRHPDVECALGVRLPLLGHEIQRKKHRFLIGRSFARLASWVLGAKCCDTQCGMKLFRVSPELESALNAPFLSRWVFDVELIKRLKLVHGNDFFNRVPLWEQPLESWEEVAGSKLRPRDFLIAGLDLWRIWRQTSLPEADPPGDRFDIIALPESDRSLPRAA